MSQVAGSGVTKARSAVTIGAFTAVYFVLMWCSGMLGFFGPIIHRENSMYAAMFRGALT